MEEGERGGASTGGFPIRRVGRGRRWKGDAVLIGLSDTSWVPPISSCDLLQKSTMFDVHRIHDLVSVRLFS